MPDEFSGLEGRNQAGRVSAMIELQFHELSSLFPLMDSAERQRQSDTVSG
jgi:hypothetical protein